MTFALALRWLASLTLGGLALMFIVANGRIALTPLREGERRPSMVPLLGGLFGAVAVSICPAARSWPAWSMLVPGALDLGTVGALVLFPAALLWSALRRGPKH